MYPSEYAFRDDSVNRAESASANCMRYQSGLEAPPAVYTNQYIHCDGKLTDSDLGQEQYQYIDYYRWSPGNDGQLLFIFPTRVSLTTIILHYYSDSIRGLPRLRFYAVPDDFDVWDTPGIGTPQVEVAALLPSTEAAGHKNVKSNVNFNTKKVLMYKFNSMHILAISEVEFFMCK